MQFTLTCRDEDGTLTRKEFDGMYLDDVVSKTQDFLHGVGFVFEELEVQTYPENSQDDGEMSSEVQMLLEDDYRSIYNDNILDR
jgi:hypothetical protein|tara:strand:- start:3053 stop:3304 length:252 start_codon:yes stop_codon:yes gene_type:complete